MTSFNPLEAAAVYEALLHSGLRQLAARWADDYRSHPPVPGAGEAFADLISEDTEA